MEILENPAAVRETLDLLRQEYLSEVREGLSLTQLLYCLTKTYLEKHEPVSPTDRELELWSVGFAMERVLIASRTVNDVWELDGIVMHPDFISLVGVLSDLKTTRAAPKPPSFDTYGGMWLRQFMGYSRYKIIEAQGLGQVVQFPYPFDVVILHVIQPTIKGWQFRFDEVEIEANWQWVLMRKTAYLAFESRGIVPTPFQYNESWECKDCRYLLRCQTLAQTLALEKNISASASGF